MRKVMSITHQPFHPPHRARLSQGLSSTLPDVWFKRIIPSCLLALWAFYIVMVFAVFPIKGRCETSLSGDRKLCLWDSDDVKLWHVAAFGLQIVLDVNMTFFFLYLFGKPLLGIIRHKKKDKG